MPFCFLTHLTKKIYFTPFMCMLFLNSTVHLWEHYGWDMAASSSSWSLWTDRKNDLTNSTFIPLSWLFSSFLLMNSSSIWIFIIAYYFSSDSVVGSLLCGLQRHLLKMVFYDFSTIILSFSGCWLMKNAYWYYFLMPFYFHMTAFKRRIDQLKWIVKIRTVFYN